jgi:hypothetical protein
MGLFGNIFNKPDKESGAKVLMNLIVDNSSIVLDKSLNSYNDKGFIFELLLCTSIHVINTYDEYYTNTTSLFQTKYLNELLKYANENNLIPKVEGDIIDFINKRIKFYNKEFDNIHLHAIIPVKTAYNLYEVPLLTIPKESDSIIQYFEVYSRLNEMFDLITKNISLTQK